MAFAPTDLRDGAVAWLRANLARFDPIDRDGRPDPLRSKALAELAFFCDYFRRALPDRREDVRPLIDFVATVWRRDEYRDLVVRHPESLQLYVLTYDSLLRSGFDVSSFAEVIQRVVDAGYATAIEAVPFRAMDFRQVLDCGGFKHGLPAMGALFERTMLHARPPLPYVTKADVYCLTHTLFYATDFGFLPTGSLPRADLRRFRPWIQQLLGLNVRQRDWDLTAELLICAHCLQSPPDLVTEAAWLGLGRAQAADGMVPAPVFDAGVERTSEAGQVRAFEDNYHTTLVAALAATLCPTCTPESN